MLADAAAAETRSIVATADAISDLDGWIERVAANWRVPSEVAFRARVCVAEIAANLMEHGRARTEGDALTVELRQDGTGLGIELSDTGRAFDPTAPVTGTASTDGVSGRGLRLLRAHAATMSYRRAAGHNILRLQVIPAQGVIDRLHTDKAADAGVNP
jgi:anti-sigma regulatory factor (Ser/Thr protein kinase)